MMYMLLLSLSFLLVTVVSILFIIMAYKKMMDSETFSPYECGFSMLSSTRLFFSFRFFLVAILFLIFDVEIVLMLPIPFLIYSTKGNFIIFSFFMLLLIGLVYEYFYGSLNWLNFMSKA